jgi:cobalt-zinc-cadmium efflux system outer membrane protein
MGNSVRAKEILKRAATLIVVPALVGGCARFQPKPIIPEQTASAFEARTLDNPGLRPFLEKNLHHQIRSWPLTTWDFSALAVAAFFYHPDLDVARAGWGVAQAGVITAGELPNPSAGFVSEYAFNSPSGVSPWILGFVVDIPIVTAGKRGYRIAQARDLSEAARLNIAAVGWLVRSRLRTSLLNLYGARESETILKRQLAIQEELVRVLERRLAVGAVSRPDVTLGQLSLDRARLSLAEAQKQEGESRVRIADAIGLPVAALDGVDISLEFVHRFPPTTNLAPQRVRRQALVNRPDILGSLAQYAATQSALQLEIAKQYPDVHLGPGYRWDQGESKWSLGISLTLPVLSQNQGPLAEAEARREEAGSRFMALQARVIGEIDRALAAYGGAVKGLEVADSLLGDRRNQEQSIWRPCFMPGKLTGLPFSALNWSWFRPHSPASALFSRFSKLRDCWKMLCNVPWNRTSPIPSLSE